MVIPLAPNKIHSLPVQVNYHIQSSSQTFSTIFPTYQQVYVHPNAGSQQVDGRDEAWGAIYLKTVIQGITLASPELHPSHPGTPDSSLYVLDPRETFLRRSRVDTVASSSAAVEQFDEVWHGKGLVSWALDEPGAGKSLITGRLVRRWEFSFVKNPKATASDDQLSALEALAAARDACQDDDGEAWGIEICIGLKSGLTNSASGFLRPLHHSVENGSVAARYNSLRNSQALAPSSTRNQDQAAMYAASNSLTDPISHPISQPAPLLATHTLPKRSLPVRHTQASATNKPAPSKPAPPSKNVPPSKTVPSKPRATTTRKRKSAADRTQLLSLDVNAHSSQTGIPSDTLRSDLSTLSNDISADIYNVPHNMTQEQAQRLLDHPSLQKLLGHISDKPGSSNDEMEPSASSSDHNDGNAAKRARNDWIGRPHHPSGELKCYNCGTQKSSVWRTKIEDGKPVRVCNACGLYFNKTKMMRPKSMWDETATKRSKTDTASTPIDKTGVSPANFDRSGGAFKRTLTMVAEKEAERIASMRATRPRQPPPPVTHPAVRAMPLTSPPRAAASLPRSVRNTKFTGNTTVAASSPGGWVVPQVDMVSSGSTPATNVATSARSPTTIRQILAGNAEMPSLALPLSDDGIMKEDGKAVSDDKEATIVNIVDDWNTNLSAFFDVDGFSGGVEAARTIGISPAPPASESRLSSDLGFFKEMPTNTADQSSDDDFFSQLFQPTSSIDNLSSSSPAPFDFSQLPPSSPPSIPSCLPHSALLLSSPSGSPLDFSPRDSESGGRMPSPQKSSRLRHSISAVEEPALDTSVAEGIMVLGESAVVDDTRLQSLLADLQDPDILSLFSVVFTDDPQASSTMIQ